MLSDPQGLMFPFKIPKVLLSNVFNSAGEYYNIILIMFLIRACKSIDNSIDIIDGFKTDKKSTVISSK